MSAFARLHLRQALALATLLLGLGVQARPTEPEQDHLLQLPLSELLQLEISTASIQPATQREQPGVVTVLTAADMAAAGARTLQDVLLLVPGVSLGNDVFNVTGLIFRGTWAYEGKILFLVDDIPVNDLLFGTYAIPPSFPVELLQRVEVLRGPGGAKYGENAELAVIRIYTRNSERRAGFATVTSAAQKDGRPLRQLSLGEQWHGERGTLALLGTVSAGSWGSGRWTDALGNKFDTADQDISSAQLALNARWQGTHMQLYAEQFELDAVQRYGILVPDQTMNFRHVNLRLEQEFQLKPATTLTPRWTYRDENTWQGTSRALPSDYELPARRHTLELEALHTFASGASWRAGAQGYWSSAQAEALVVPEFPGLSPANYFRGGHEVSYRSRAIYAEAEQPWKRYRLSLGLRHSEHSLSGQATLPRLALTRAEPDWHLKGLIGSAYREPQIETANQSAIALEPEYTSVYELEGGHRLGQHHYLTASLFRYRLRDAIVFSATPDGVIGYVNSPPYRGEGLELQWRLQQESWRLDANYQRSRTDDDAIAVYDVQGRHGQSLGAPRDVVNLWLGWQFLPDWSLHPRLRYQGARTAFVFDPAGNSAGLPLSQARLDPELTLDVSVRYRRWPWTLDLGLRNLGDEERLLPQPYAGISPPYPAGGREGWLRLQYDF